MADTTQELATKPTGGFSLLALLRRPDAGAAAGFILIFVFFSIFGWDKNFLTPLGASTWLNFASKVGIIAIPIGFLMIAGELDISVGALIPAGVASSLRCRSNCTRANIWLGVLLSLADRRCHRVREWHAGNTH